MHCAPRALLVSAQHGQDFITLLEIALDSVGGSLGKLLAATDRRRCLERLTYRASRLPMSFETKTSNLRAGNLHHAYFGMAQKIHDLLGNGRPFGRPTVSGILIQQALNEKDESPAPWVFSWSGTKPHGWEPPRSPMLFDSTIDTAIVDHEACVDAFPSPRRQES